MTRRGVLDLDGEWRFALDPQRTGGAHLPLAGPPVGAGTIRVPGSWQEQGHGSPDPLQEVRWPTWRHQYHGLAWYARTVDVPREWAGSRLELELERVNWLTRCWVNGTPAGEGESIATPQRFDLTPQLCPGERNLLVLSVDSWRPDLGNYNE
ncbi:MAG: glycoside hydrolase family 2, partial [Chloroflexota bacterium]|nr:glycoside hydrolase family 2 [Chloroflexota bacterium]